VPLTRNDERRPRLPEFEQRERVVTQTRTPHIVEYEQKHKAKVEEIRKDFTTGEKSDRARILARDDCR
jgi:hypothetical protein